MFWCEAEQEEMEGLMICSLLLIRLDQKDYPAVIKESFEVGIVFSGRNV